MISWLALLWVAVGYFNWRIADDWLEKAWAIIFMFVVPVMIIGSQL